MMDRFRARKWQAVLAALEGEPRRRLLVIVVALVTLLGIEIPEVGAQAGTPSAGLDVPAAAECTVAPRSEDELRALFREVAATPIPTAPEASPTPAIAPAGPPADAQTVAEISDTWRQYLACISAGDQARMFALSSDAMVRQLVVDIAFGVSEEALFAFLAATPVPLPADPFVPFLPFKDVRVLSDGRVAVVGPGGAWGRAIGRGQGSGESRGGATCASSSRRAATGCSMSGSICHRVISGPAGARAGNAPKPLSATDYGSCTVGRSWPSPVRQRSAAKPT